MSKAPSGAHGIVAAKRQEFAATRAQMAKGATRAARLAHITPPARRLAPRAPRSLATSWNARALAVDVLAVDIDYATESMCT